MSTAHIEAWNDRRPVFNRLPETGYQDNEVADALTQWGDEKLSIYKDTIEEFYKELDPVTCKDASLDYLGWLNGFSGRYWDQNWRPSVKRAMISNGHTYLWRRRGTLSAIQKVLDIHGYMHHLWTDGQLRLPFPLGSKFASPKMRVYVRLPISYHRNGLEYREAIRTLENFAPAVVTHQACYDQFYLGFSRVGDPLFS